MGKSTVYFTDFRCPVGTSQLDKLKKLCIAAGIKDIDMDGKFVAIKMHFGELGNMAFLRPNYAKVIADLCKEQGGMPFLTDCNTLYPGSRKNALEHLDCANLNGFNTTTTGCQIIIGDGLRGTDEVEVPVVNGEYCKTALIGHAIMDADIFISLSHFKGHETTGFGGAIKNIGMGVITDYSQAGRMIVSQTERMSKLIEDILYLSKMESGTEPLKCEPIEMASLVQDILMPLEGIVNRRNLSVSLELDEGYVNGDPEKLEHAVANLITNSVKYACSQIEISWKNQVLSIWNDGGELSTEDFSHMFERFHTGQNGNSGIGLALSKEIVEMHGWKLSAKNDRHGICLSMVCHS